MSTLYYYRNGVVIRSETGVPDTGLFGPKPVASITTAEQRARQTKKLMLYGAVAVAAYFLAKEVF